MAHANRTLSANPPTVTEKLGTSPTEVEVADRKPSWPGENEDFRMENGGINASAVVLKDLMQFAYDLDDDALKGDEKWLEKERFDIVAQSAPTASENTFSENTLRMMLRALLMEWFGPKTH